MTSKSMCNQQRTIVESTGRPRLAALSVGTLCCNGYSRKRSRPAADTQVGQAGVVAMHEREQAVTRMSRGAGNARGRVDGLANRSDMRKHEVNQQQRRSDPNHRRSRRDLQHGSNTAGRVRVAVHVAGRLHDHSRGTSLLSGRRCTAKMRGEKRSELQNRRGGAIADAGEAWLKGGHLGKAAGRRISSILVVCYP